MSEADEVLELAEILELQEEEENSNLAKIKTVLLTLKALHLIFESLRAVPAWSGKIRIQGLLLCSALIVGAAYVYNMSTKELLPLFLMQGFSMWITTLCLPALLEELPNENESVIAAKSSVMKFQYATNAGFALAFVSAFKMNSAQCDPSSSIATPWGFYVTFVIFLIHWLHTVSLHNKGFSITWSPEDKKVKDLFMAQALKFVSTTGMLVKWHLVELMAGVFLSRRNISCINEGKSWAYANAVGSIYFFLHVVGVKLAGGMIRTVFIKTVKASGYWLSSADLVEDDIDVDTKKTQ